MYILEDHSAQFLSSWMPVSDELAFCKVFGCTSLISRDLPAIAFVNDLLETFFLYSPPEPGSKMNSDPHYNVGMRSNLFSLLFYMERVE